MLLEMDTLENKLQLSSRMRDTLFEKYQVTVKDDKTLTEKLKHKPGYTNGRPNHGQKIQEHSYQWDIWKSELKDTCTSGMNEEEKW